MARPRRTSAPQLTAGQAVWVLNRLIKERRVSAADVNRCVGDMTREIRELEQRLQELRSVQGAAAPAGAAPRTRGRAARKAAPAAAKAPRKRGRKSITPEQLASQKLQGRYLGLVRQFPASRRPFFAKIAKEKGREAAIKEMLDQKKK